MTTLSPIPEPTPEEIRRGLAAAEYYAQSVDPPPRPAAPPPGVESRRVRKLRQQVAEARQLDALMDEALATDTHRVRRRRAFATLDHGGGVPGGTNGEYRANAVGRYTPSTPTPRADIGALTARARALIDARELPPFPGVHKLRDALGVGTTVARRVQNALNGQ